MSRMAFQKQERLPQQVGEPRFIQTEDQRYEVLTFKDGEGPTLAQTIAIAKERGQELLTLDEARAIRDNEQTNAAFRSILKPGKWTYVRDKKLEGRSRAAFLCHYFYRGLGAGGCYGPDLAARVVVLKAKPDATQSGTEARFRQLQKEIAELSTGVQAKKKALEQDEQKLAEKKKQLEEAKNEVRADAESRIKEIRRKTEELTGNQ